MGRHRLHQAMVDGDVAGGMDVLQTFDQCGHHEVEVSVGPDPVLLRNVPPGGRVQPQKHVEHHRSQTRDGLPIVVVGMPGQKGPLAVS